MSVDFYVAVEQANWPTPAALNQCISELHYPVQLVDIPNAEMGKRLATMPHSIGLFVKFEGKKVPLEASIVQLGPNSPYAYGLRKDAPVLAEKTSSDGKTKAVMYAPGPNSFEPKDINSDLRAIGHSNAQFKHGDYVLSLSFRSQIPEYRAGSYLMAGLIKCSAGLGFEFQGPSFGTTDYADGLARAAADVNSWK